MLIDVSTPWSGLANRKPSSTAVKCPLAVVQEENRFGRRRQHQILVAVVVDVGEERRGGVVQDAEARLVGDVFESRVAAIPVEPIGQSGRLGDVEILEAVAVHVADRDAVMPVRIARQDRVERRHPGIEVDGQLPAERVGASERRLGDLGEDRSSRAADHVRRRGPPDDLPARGVAAPDHLPLADVLDAVRLRPGADDVVADRGAKARGGITSLVGLDRGDEELGDGDLAHVADQPLELGGEGARIERRIARQILRSRDLELRLARRPPPGPGATGRRESPDRAGSW